MMHIRSLKDTSIPQITECFNLAFANYFVKFNATPAYFEHRWKGSGVDLSHSMGVFDGDRLVGFIINAIDPWHGKLTAYNAGTGVIPEFRGQRLVAKMYQTAIPLLKEAGVQQICLEVICQNEKAIKAYQSVGMKIDRKLRCYAGEIEVKDALLPDVKIQKRMIAQWELYQQFWEVEPAWEHLAPTIERIREDYTIYELYKKEICCGYAIINPQNGAVPQFAIHPDYRRQGLGKMLFHHLSKVRPKLKLNNIDDRSQSIVDFLLHLGFNNPLDQYEMSAILD